MMNSGDAFFLAGFVLIATGHESGLVLVFMSLVYTWLSRR